MQILYFVLIVVFATTPATPAAAKKKFHPPQFVVKGGTASEGQFPFIASIQQNNAATCGASIISKRWVITAAHCIKSDIEGYNFGPAELQLLIGTNVLNQSGVTYNLEKIIVHEGFNDQNSFEHDIALLKVDRDIEFNDRVSLIHLEMQNVPDGSEVFSAGWGQTSPHGGPASNDLLFLSMKTVDTQTCRNDFVSHNEPVFDSNICSKPSGGQGTCSGDSGGPLLYNTKLVGVLSWGLVCGGPEPEVYARVSSYRDWINNNMDEEYQT